MPTSHPPMRPHQASRHSRDQLRALYAYNAVGQVKGTDSQRDYWNTVAGLGADILGGGLAAALSALERRGNKSGSQVLDHLAGASIPGLEGTTAANLAARVRDLDVDTYIRVTREILRVAAWLKRAAQATFDRNP